MQIDRRVVDLDINDVLPNRFQPRIKFNEISIQELSDSIKKYGVIQPIVVRKIGDKYEIIAGERRYKASVLAGKTTIPAIITDLNDKDSAEVALIENVQRQNLTPIEEAISYKKTSKNIKAYFCFKPKKLKPWYKNHFIIVAKFCIIFKHSIFANH